MLQLVVACALSLPPDYSRAYFSELSRPSVPQVEVDRAGGPLILIVVDAMRPDRLTPYGSKRLTAPNMGRLADEGLILTNYFVNGNWTRPSAASLVTGLFPGQHAVEGEHDRLAKQIVTLGEILGAAGVPTGAVVGNGNAGSAFGLGRGFDYFADTVSHWSGLPSAQQVVDLALPFIRSHASQPFFLWLFMVDPHDPYHAPEPFETMFADPRVPLIRTPHWELGRYSPAEIERMMATYDSAVRYTDTVLGGFFEELRRMQLYDKATIVVTSDHGEAFGEHGVFLHSHHLYDEIVRAPLIIKAPRMSKRGGYNHYLFQTVDLFPTIAKSFAAPVPNGLPGLDIFAHLAEPRRNDPERAVVCEFRNFGISRRMVRTYDRKVIHADPADAAVFTKSVGRKELLPSVSFTEERVQMYDLATDPFERRDVYGATGSSADPIWERLLRQARQRQEGRRASEMAQVGDSLDPETRRDLEALGYIQ